MLYSITAYRVIFRCWKLRRKSLDSASDRSVCKHIAAVDRSSLWHTWMTTPVILLVLLLHEAMSGLAVVDLVSCILLS